MTPITTEVLDELLSGVATADDLLGEQGLMKELKVRLMERMLGAELTEHLGTANLCHAGGLPDLDTPPLHPVCSKKWWLKQVYI